MNYSIVYSSKTGNTALLAQKIQALLPQASCVYCGAPDETPAQAGLIFAGFWTDKGDCDERSSAFLKDLRGKKVFLFGTAGFGGSAEYFEAILSRVGSHLDSSNEVVGAYMCQGKMPLAVRQRYESMTPKEPEKMKGLMDNFDRGSSHPNAADLEGLAQAVANCL